LLPAFFIAAARAIVREWEQHSIPDDKVDIGGFNFGPHEFEIDKGHAVD
jgi:hypothetical protein